MRDAIDTNVISKKLLQLLLFVESVNRTVAGKLEAGQPASVQSAVLETRIRLISRLKKLRKLKEKGELKGSGIEWAPNIDIASQLKSFGKLPNVDIECVNEISRFLLLPVKIQSEDKEAQWKLERRESHLPEVAEPESIKNPGLIHVCGESLEFSDHKEHRATSGRVRSSLKLLEVEFCEQVLDPIAVAQNFLLGELKTHNIATADFYIQRALKKLFFLRYSDVAKFVLSDLCETLNYRIFEFPRHSIRRTPQSRSATLTTGLLLGEIAKVIDRQCGELPHANAFFDNPERAAVGLMLFLRVCRVLRIRYSWLSEKTKASFAEDSDIVSGVDGKQCVTALRPIEYMYLQKRIFGSLSEIPGLNFVFGGGVLPRTKGGRSIIVSGPSGSGKTVLALQKLVNVASHGGLAVYFSFEESYQLIFDRLLSFGLLDPRRYIVAQAGKDVEERISSHFKEKRCLGQLVLFGKGKHGDYALGETIKLIGNAARKTGRGAEWRALVIDSINALTLGGRASPRGGEPPVVSQRDADESRPRLRRIINKIESNGFLGIIINEEPGDDEFRYLSYLADTVIRLGFDAPRQKRWMEIAKARGQDFHPGRHMFRLIAGSGIRIYPSSAALRESLRRKSRSTLSQKRWIPISSDLRVVRSKVTVKGRIRLKSSTLIHGSESGGKTGLALSLVTGSSESFEQQQDNSTHPTFNLRSGTGPSSVLVINFRTPEVRLLQEIGRDGDLKWAHDKYYLHAYSPGRNVTSDQIVGKVWKYIQESRRSGLPIERILFDEVESAEILLPSLAEDRLFWPTLIELCGAEAITVFFVHGGADLRSEVLRIVSSEVDYVIRSYLRSGGKCFEVEKAPVVAKYDFQPMGDAGGGST